jgi:rSAM-partnered protein
MTDEADPTTDAATGTGARSTTDGASRTRVAAPRADDEPEWELFLRETPGDPLHHAGSVTAPNADRAHERAAGLFPAATTVWCCRAAEIARFTERDLGADYREAPAQGGEEA